MANHKSPDNKNEMKRLIITGGSGLLGGELVRQTKERYDILYTWLNHPAQVSGVKGVFLDVLDKDRTLGLFKDFQPHAVIHTAYSQENMPSIAQGTLSVAAASSAIGARLLHLSTDAIFDGGRGWYGETDIPAPVHAYGRAKLDAERAVEQAGLPSLVIIRTSLLLSLNPMDERTLFLKKQLEMNRKTVYFTDEYRCPVIVQELAAAILEILELDFTGIINIAGPERMSRYELSRKLADYLGLNPDYIIPGLSSESGNVRPLDCSLDTSLSRRLLRTIIHSPGEILSRQRQVKK